MPNKIKLSTILSLALALQALPVASETEASPAAARALFSKGNALVKEGKYAEALSTFSDSYALSPKPVVRFNMGMCLKAMDRLGKAAEYLQLYLAEAGDAPKPDLRQQAEATIREIEAELPEISFEGVPAGSAIRIDNAPEELFADGTVLRPDPGTHTIRIVAPNMPPFETELTLTAGERRTVAFAAPKQESATTDSPSPAAAPARNPREEASTEPAPSLPRSETVVPGATETRRFFYSPVRAAWFAGSLVMLSTGIVMTAVSWSAFQEDLDRKESLQPINTSGWTIAGVGLGSLGLFLISGALHRAPSEKTAFGFLLTDDAVGFHLVQRF